MLISVVITTKNEEKHIANCIESILAQDFLSDENGNNNKNKIEIIVVDNKSTDKTKDIARDFAGRSGESGVEIKIFDKGPERSAQRNFGVAQSRGEYFLFLDADMVLSPNVVSECVTKVKDYKLRINDCDVVAGLYIPEIIMGESFWCKVRKFERSFYNGTVIDCARFVNRKIFDGVGGFDETMTGPEDWDLDKKIQVHINSTIVAQSNLTF